MQSSSANENAKLNKKVIIHFLNNLPLSPHVDALAERIKDKYTNRRKIEENYAKKVQHECVS